MSVDPPSPPSRNKAFRDKPLTAADPAYEDIDPSMLSDPPDFVDVAARAPVGPAPGGIKSSPDGPASKGAAVPGPPSVSKTAGPTGDAPAGPMAPSPEETSLEPGESRRALRRYRRSEADDDREGDDAEGEILLLSALLRRLVEKKLNGPEESEAKPKNNRFVSRASAAGGAVPAEVTPAAPQAAPSMKMKPRTDQGANTGTHWQQSRFPLGKSLLCAALLFAFGMLLYLMGRNAAGASPRAARTGPAAAPRAELTPTWSAKTIALLDAVLAADQAGDMKTAANLARELRMKMPGTPSVDLYLSTLEVRQGEFDETEERIVKLSDAFTPPLEAAAVNEGLGFIYARHRDLPRAASSFQDAAATDPFNPRHYQHWAEALRRQGQLQEAVDHFRQALLRLPPGQPGTVGERSEIELKINLSQIESGKDDDVKTALDSHSKDLPVSGYWLLTAAAYALQHGDMAAATDNLQRARLILPTEVYAALTNDYFFHNFAGNKEMASLLPADKPAVRQAPFQPQMGYFLDP